MDPPKVTRVTSQITSENWNTATPVTSAGTMRGDRHNALSVSRPGKSPRASARAAGTPTRTAITTVIDATIRLT